MRRRFVVALPLLLAAAVVTRKPDADGQPFPDAGPRVVTVRLPLSGTALGGLPEEVPGCARLFAIDSGSPVVADWRKLLVAHHVDTTGYDYISNGSDGARCVLIGLTDGRVSRLAYFFPGLTPGRAAAILKPFSGAGAGTDPQGAAFRLTQGGIRVVGGLTGSHDVTVTDYHRTTIADYNAGDSGTSTHVDSYPSCIVLGVEPLDWYLAAHAPAPEIATALREGRLAVGMTLLESRLAMGCEGTAAGADGAGEAFRWAAPGHSTYIAVFQGGHLVRFRQEG